MTDFSKSEDKKGRVEHAIRARNIKWILWTIGILIVLAILIGGGMKYSSERNKNLPGVSYLEVGREHIALNGVLPKPYNSNPPSSGAHFSSPANWKMYDYEVNDKIFIHNLEHGGVWISYRPSISSEAVGQLKQVVHEFMGSKLVMAPRSANDTDIAVVAWTRVLAFNLNGPQFSDQEINQVRAFYKSFKNRGPEFVPDTMPGVDPKSVQ